MEYPSESFIWASNYEYGLNERKCQNTYCTHFSNCSILVQEEGLEATVSVNGAEMPPPSTTCRSGGGYCAVFKGSSFTCCFTGTLELAGSTLHVLLPLPQQQPNIHSHKWVDPSTPTSTSPSDGIQNKRTGRLCSLEASSINRLAMVMMMSAH